MNKYTKAYKRIIDILVVFANQSNFLETTDVLKELVDKETPEDVKNIDFEPVVGGINCCPVCGLELGDSRCNYCSFCGQRIKWDEC